MSEPLDLTQARNEIEILRACLRESEALISRLLTDDDYFTRPRNRDSAERMHVRLSELIAWPPRQG
jgi:hypothetical protein